MNRQGQRCSDCTARSPWSLARPAGQAIARTFAGQGADLVLSDRAGSELEALAAQCREWGVRARTVLADLSDSREAASLGPRALEAFERIDTVVCNAGMQGPAGPLLDVGRADWSKSSR